MVSDSFRNFHRLPACLPGEAYRLRHQSLEYQIVRICGPNIVDQAGEPVDIS